MSTANSARLLSNRSIPDSAVIPVLLYPDVVAAATWLCRAFGFVERLRIGTHRIQLVVPSGIGALVVAEETSPASAGGAATHSIMVRVADVDSHFAQAQASGAKVLNPPTTYPFGERQYTAADRADHVWTFTQTVADVDPKTWGGEWVREKGDA